MSSIFIFELKPAEFNNSSRCEEKHKIETVEGFNQFFVRTSEQHADWSIEKSIETSIDWWNFDWLNWLISILQLDGDEKLY